MRAAAAWLDLRSSVLNADVVLGKAWLGGKAAIRGLAGAYAAMRVIAVECGSWWSGRSPGERACAGKP